MVDDRGKARNAYSKLSPMWLLAGLAIGLVVAPAAAVAATVSVVSIAGSNGTRAVVEKTGQLLTTAAPLASSRTFYAWNLTSAGCVKIFTSPAGSSFVLQSASIDIWQDPTPGEFNNVQLATTSGCSTGFADDHAPSLGSTQFAFGNGIVIPAGMSVYARVSGAIGCEIYGYGYTVPVADAPTETPAVAGTGSSETPHASGGR
jgi:hypothetical protein